MKHLGMLLALSTPPALQVASYNTLITTSPVQAFGSSFFLVNNLHYTPTASDITSSMSGELHRGGGAAWQIFKYGFSDACTHLMMPGSTIKKTGAGFFNLCISKQQDSVLSHARQRRLCSLYYPFYHLLFSSPSTAVAQLVCPPPQKTGKWLNAGPRNGCVNPRPNSLRPSHFESLSHLGLMSHQRTPAGCGWTVAGHAVRP